MLLIFWKVVMDQKFLQHTKPRWPENLRDSPDHSLVLQSSIAPPWQLNNPETAKLKHVSETTIEQERIQSNAKHSLAESMSYIKFEGM